METRQIDILNTPVRSEARDLAHDRVRQFAASLLLEAKVCATIDSSGLVLPKHVQEATEKVYSKYRVSSMRELRLAFGGALFGAFIQGFITELADKNQTMVVVYTVLGLFGMFLVLWDLKK